MPLWEANGLGHALPPPAVSQVRPAPLGRADPLWETCLAAGGPGSLRLSPAAAAAPGEGCCFCEVHLQTHLLIFGICLPTGRVCSNCFAHQPEEGTAGMCSEEQGGSAAGGHLEKVPKRRAQGGSGGVRDLRSPEVPPSSANRS